MMPSFLNPIYILAILLALSVHEWAHGFVANRLGDPTAKEQGRLTLNPLAHLDPLGTILFLIVGFGWGKPVPIDPRYFKNPKRDIALTAIAGPVSNLLMAIVSFVVLLFLHSGTAVSVNSLLAVPQEGAAGYIFLVQFFSSFLFLNLGLMAFNLLPIAPLDGSKVLGAFIPYRYEIQYEELMQRGPWILLGLIVAEQLIGFPLLNWWIFTIMNAVLSVFDLLVAR